MKRNMRALLVLIMICALFVCAVSVAEGKVSTRMIIRVSKLTQKAVVNVGEDLSMEVSIDGVAPERYQWYFNETPIEGETDKVIYLSNAQMEDSGIYRLDAFDADGSMLVSMDVNARVVDPAVPKAGDDSLPVEIAAVGFLLAAAVLAITLRRKARG